MNNAPAIVTDDPDNIIRCQWAAGRPAEAIRADLGAVYIGVVGERVHALGLPVRDHRLELVRGVPFELFDPELGSTKHLSGTERCPDECICGRCEAAAEV